jgi:hypothetical protein
VPAAAAGQTMLLLQDVGKLNPSSTDFDDLLIAMSLPK